MKQASSGGQIYNLGHRIIISKTSTINLLQESPHNSIKIVMLDVIFIKSEFRCYSFRRHSIKKKQLFQELFQ